MGLTITAVSIGDAETQRAVRQALCDLGADAGEEWTARIIADGNCAWEFTLDGPRRSMAPLQDWEILRHDESARYRRILQGSGEQSATYVKNIARRVLWQRIEFRENPIRTVSPELGSAFEEAVWDVLRHEPEPFQVRFGVWRDGPEALQFVCKVETTQARGPARATWRWWSPLIRRPEDLNSRLREAMDARRRRQVIPSRAVLERLGVREASTREREHEYAGSNAASLGS
jgi:hypothetical protein